MMFGGMKPIQKSTTLSSSSSVTRNADGSVTTRSRSTSVGVSVDPAGVVNALMTLMQK
jgi:ribonuclease PH